MAKPLIKKTTSSVFKKARVYEFPGFGLTEQLKFCKNYVWGLIK